MSVGGNIRRIRQQYGMTQGQFGSIAGVSAAAVSQWEKDGAAPRLGAVQCIADYFGIPVSAVLDSEAADFLHRVPVPSGKAMVPLLTFGKAGKRQRKVEVLETVLSGHPRAFAFTVRDGCMDRVIPRGCHALVDPGLQPAQGSIAVVELDGGRVVMRRWHQEGDVLFLTTDSHKSHDNIAVALDEGSVRVIGTVVWFQPAEEME
jgi:repressor LexA